MSTDTVVNANLYLRSTETDLRDEACDETFWDALAVDHALENEYDGQVPESVIVRKTKKKSIGDEFIQFGMTKDLVGEGRYDDEILVGHEEKMRSEDNAVYFSAARHGVPFPLKGLESHYNEAFNLLQKRQTALAKWNGKLSESWGWQGLVKGCPDKVFAKHGSSSPQPWHPTIYTIDSGGVTRITWDATPATYETAIDTAISAQTTGDVVDLDRIDDVEVLCANHNLRKVPVSMNGETRFVYIWAYPRAARKRIKGALRDLFASGDVRGPQNRAFFGEKFLYGQFLFVEAAYIPTLLESGSGTITYEDAWGYSATDNKRADRRTTTKGMVHAILGADALCLAEPEKIQYDFERQDYRAKEGIGTYRLFGTRRNETYDDRTSVTSVTNQSSILLIENNG